jgi:protein-S-isoprenylcysteine O-methyltransferase Ste14
LHDLPLGLAFAASMLVWAFGEQAVMQRSRGQRISDWTYNLIAAVTALSQGVAGAAAVASVAPLPGGVWWPVASGLVLMWLGMTLRVWSIRTMGRMFTLTLAIQEGHHVVMDGPYRWVRHPSYAGALLGFIGIGLVCSDWVSLAVMTLGPSAVLIVRMRAEERVLSDELGEDYALYAKRTARLVPGIL